MQNILNFSSNFYESFILIVIGSGIAYFLGNNYQKNNDRKKIKQYLIRQHSEMFKDWIEFTYQFSQNLKVDEKAGIIEITIEKFDALLQIYLNLDSKAKEKLSELTKLKEQFATIMNKQLKDRTLTNLNIEKYNSIRGQIQDVLNFTLPLILNSKIKNL